MRARRLFALVLLLHVAAAAPSWAAPEKDAQAAARARGEQGLSLFEASKWAEAFDAFREADALYHAPTLVLFMAHCRRNQGKLLAARELYEQVAAEPLSKGTPEQFAKAVSSARAELDTLKQRIPSVRLSISGAPADQTRVTIDGVRISAEEQASGKPMDPGSYEIAAEAGGGVSAKKTITLKPGEAAWVELVVQKAIKHEPVSSEAPSRLPAVIALGVGGASVGLGVITGSVALSQITDIRSRCTADGHCLKSDEPKARTAETLVTVSTVGFVAGGAGLAAGVLLWFLRPGAAKAKENTSAHIELGIGSIAIGGRF